MQLEAELSRREVVFVSGDELLLSFVNHNLHIWVLLQQERQCANVVNVAMSHCKKDTRLNL